MENDDNKIKKIMFVCTGNTCRSVMAEGLMKKMLQDRGEYDIEVYSAGLRASTGEYSTDEAVMVMKEDYDVKVGGRFRFLEVENRNLFSNRRCYKCKTLDCLCYGFGQAIL